MSIITPDRFMLALHKTPVLLNALLRGVTQEQALQSTDGPDGWSVVETMCHIRDFTEVSLDRARLILQQDQPLFPDFNPREALERRTYAKQNLANEIAAFLSSRRTLIDLLNSLSAEQWQRRGTHSVYGEMTLLDLTVHITWHDLNHIEQIARSLKLSDALL